MLCLVWYLDNAGWCGKISPKIKMQHQNIKSIWKTSVVMPPIWVMGCTWTVDNCHTWNVPFRSRHLFPMFCSILNQNTLWYFSISVSLQYFKISIGEIVHRIVNLKPVELPHNICATIYPLKFCCTALVSATVWMLTKSKPIHKRQTILSPKGKFKKEPSGHEPLPRANWLTVNHQS
jgi:hypothetical protein